MQEEREINGRTNTKTKLAKKNQNRESSDSFMTKTYLRGETNETDRRASARIVDTLKM
jgi:hypothetical protein